MQRTMTASNARLTLQPHWLFAMVPALAAGSLGCHGVESKTYYQADSGNVGCSSGPEIPCDVVAASPSSCTGAGQDATGNAALLPTDASFPPGCQAYLRAADCSSRGYCTCDAQDDAGGAAFWNCHDGSDGVA